MTPQERLKLKARFFGMHIGCALYWETKTNRTLTGVRLKTKDENFHLVTFVFDDGQHGVDNLTDCKVILRPLSSITDQEAIECAKIALDDLTLSMDNCSVNRSAGAVWVRTITKERFFIFFDFGDDCMFAADDSQEDEIRFRAIEVADWLRSKSYCLPFNGLDPIAEGWAVLEETNQPQG